MRTVGAGFRWVLGWLMLSGTIGLGLVAYTLAMGGRLHRVATCGRGGDANIFALGMLAASLAAIAVLAWWALGARSLRWRWARVILVAMVIPLIAVGAIVGGGAFSFACMGGPVAG